MEDIPNKNSVTLYKETSILRSILKEGCSIGDFSRVIDCSLLGHVKIDRNNLLMHSSIGKHTYTGRNTTIMHSTIGNFCSISWNVTIGGGEHDYRNITNHDFLYNVKSSLNPGIVSYDRYEKPVEIGHDVWVGAGAVILRGVRIGNGCVIGANSVVTNDVPDYAIIIGNPGRVLKYRFDKKTIERLNKIKWWKFDDHKLRNLFDQFSTSNIIEILEKIES